MSEVLQFYVKRGDIDFYTLSMPPYGDPESPVLLTANSNSVIYQGEDVVRGVFRSNVSIGNSSNELQLTSGLMTVTFDDEYKSSISWNITFESESGRFPSSAKYILNLTSGSGIYINQTGVIVLDVTPNYIQFYVKFYPSNVIMLLKDVLR